MAALTDSLSGTEYGWVKISGFLEKYEGKRETTEDKKIICEAFCRTLRATHEFEDIEAMDYKKHDCGLEIVTVRFKNGCVQRVDVTYDSGIALIKDILASIYRG